MRTSIPDCSIPQISSFVNRQGLLFPGCPCSLQSSPLYNPAFLAGSPPCTRRPLLKKGSIRKLFCGWQHTFHGRAKNPEYRSRCSLGTDLWTPVPSGFAFTNLKKFLRVPRGVFSKTPLGGSGTEYRGRYDLVAGEFLSCFFIAGSN